MDSNSFDEEGMRGIENNLGHSLIEYVSSLGFYLRPERGSWIKIDFFLLIIEDDHVGKVKTVVRQFTRDDEIRRVPREFWKSSTSHIALKKKGLPNEGNRNEEKELLAEKRP